MAVGQGISLFPWRAAAWSGQQTWTTTDHGEHLAVKIAGGYVGGQGLELRTFPGWKCVINPADGAPASPGYQQLVVDAERPVAGPKGPTDTLRERVPYGVLTSYGAGANVTADVDESMRVWTERRSLFSFHRLRDKVILVAETGLRIEPIMDSATRTVISKVSKWTRVAGVAVVMLTPNPGAIVADSPNQIQVGDVIYLGDIVDTNVADAARLARRCHYVTAYNAGTGEATLSTTVAAASASTTLAVNVGRTRGNRTGPSSFAPDGIGEFEQDATLAIQDAESLTAFWVEDPIDIDGTPIQAAHPSYVANRQRDFGDIAYTAGGFRRLEGHRPTAFGGTARFGIPRRRTIKLPYRPVPQVAGDRLLMAVPGYGCIMQIPAIIPTTSSTSSYPTRGPVQNYNDSAARPRSLGVPKAILAVPNDVTGTPVITVRADLLGYAPNNTGAPVATTVRVAAAYRDEATGEVGLLSEVWSFTVTVPNGNSLDLRAWIMHPAYALCECLAFSIMLFVSKPNEEALLHVATIQANDDKTGIFAGPNFYVNGMGSSSVYGLDGTSGSGGFCAEMFWVYSFPAALASTPSLFNASVEIPTERNMPRGASWLRVVRGVRLSGGGVGDVGQKLELQSGQADLLYAGSAGIHNKPKEITITRITDELTYRDEWPFIGGRFIPSSYGGCRVWSRTLFPHPQEAATLEQLVNAHGDATMFATAPGGGGEVRHFIRWSCIENPHRWDGTRSVNNQAAYIVLPRGVVQIGEPGLPSVQSGFGNQIVDAQKDEDTVAGGEIRGVALMMTQFETYAMSWSQGPAGAVPVLLSNSFGCIAPNTSIEYDGGAFWLSGRGPCVCNGEVVQSISNLDKWFHGETSRFLRDSQGMMRHAWAYHDATRELVMVGVLENRSNITIQWSGVATTWAAANDQAKSRFPCDTILVMNTVNGAWTEWHAPAGMEVLWMGSVPCIDGVSRTSFLAADGRIHSLDDLFGEDNQEPLQVSINEGTAGSFVVVTASLSAGQAFGIDNTARGGRGALVRVGMDVCVFDNSTYELKFRGPITEIDPAGSSIKLGGTGSWPGNCIALIGARTMSMTMTAVTPKGVDPTTIQAITVKGKLASRLQSDGAQSLRQPTWVKAWVSRSTDKVNLTTEGGDDRRIESRMHTNSLGDLFGVSDASDTPRSKRLHQGAVTAKTLQVRLEVFGGSQACLNDVLMEVS